MGGDLGCRGRFPEELDGWCEIVAFPHTRQLLVVEETGAAVGGKNIEFLLRAVCRLAFLYGERYKPLLANLSAAACHVEELVSCVAGIGKQDALGLGQVFSDLFL